MPDTGETSAPSETDPVSENLSITTPSTGGAPLVSPIVLDPAQDTGATEPDHPGRPGLRTRTVVFGLILLVVAGCVLIGQLTSVNVDPGAVALGVMVAAGLILIAGARTPSR